MLLACFCTTKRNTVRNDLKILRYFVGSVDQADRITTEYAEYTE